MNWIMDFNEIKNTWKDSFNENERLNSSQIETMLKLKRKSNTAIEKIKRSFKLELITGTLMYLFIISALFYLVKTPEVLVFFIIITLLIGTSLYFYYRNYKKIKHVVYAENTLRQTLIKTINDIEKFVNIGKGNLLKFIMIPLATITGMIIGLFIGTGENNIIEIFSTLKTKSIVKMGLLLIIFSGLLIPFSKYWFKRKFKKHYDELKKCLNEFEETTSN